MFARITIKYIHPDSKPRPEYMLQRKRKLAGPLKAADIQDSKKGRN